MKALIFNGALERRPESTSGVLSDYFAEQLNQLGIANSVFNLADSGIPLFDSSLSRIPNSVRIMNNLFLEADVHFWLSPLYHGSIPGVMKNCLDWLEISAKNSPAYLTDKNIGLVCWADGVQALQGINAMDTIAKSLRAWTLPFSVPIVKSGLFEASSSRTLSSTYKRKLDLLINIATTRAAVFEIQLGRS
ncbi:NADPH-dependent FMN reductase [Sphingobacterium sp. HMA12]|uniref:NADPH-dependent FMN reductase n=1 Tax=Sphingobacterium sp. HMA12 TaxID=2050894 RepID=UPI000CEA3CFD|nr:NADPH-dependent FMN reductase [Sphingobacterium sp. HMA12]